jgi:hypothetical protein
MSLFYTPGVIFEEMVLRTAQDRGNFGKNSKSYELCSWYIIL